MISGLSATERRFLHDEVIQPLQRAGYRVWCFGSRARGDERRFSDVDLLVSGDGNPRRLVGAIEERLVDSNFPYKVDIVIESDLAEAYRDRVLRERTPLDVRGLSERC